MKDATQQSWARVLLPAAAILALYVGVFAIPKMRQASGLRASTPTTYSTDAAAEAERDLRAELADARSRITALDQRQRLLMRELFLEDIQTASAKVGNVARAESAGAETVGAETVRRVSGMMTSRGLTLVAQGPVDRAAGALMPVYFSPATLPASAGRRRASRPDTPPAVLWRFEFVGGYSDALAMLRDLDASDVSAIPAGVAMEPTDEPSTLKRWKLLLWI